MKTYAEQARCPRHPERPVEDAKGEPIPCNSCEKEAVIASQWPAFKVKKRG